MVEQLAAALAKTGAPLVAPTVVDSLAKVQPVLWYQRFFGLQTTHQLPGSFPYLSGCCLLVRREMLVEGKLLPKGKYSFFLLQQGGRSWNLIFNKTWDQWGAFKYKKEDDVFRVPVRGLKPAAFAEKLTYTISADGIVSLLWGDKQIDFQVQEKK